MPSPFPGMDPFLENQEWEDFHTTWNTVVREMLSPRIEPRYVVRVERRVYVEHPRDDETPWRRSDIAILLAPGAPGGAALAVAPAATEAVPVECDLPMSEERREAFLVIRERETMEVVTVMETLSPGNKRAGGEGRQEYLSKREAILQSPSHLVELDLLRGGLRLPSVKPLPVGDYYAIVSRSRRRPKANVYAWSLRQALPVIPIPLKSGDPDVPLELQTGFTTVFDRARYDLSLDYGQPLIPALSDPDAQWVRQVLPQRGP